MSYPVSLRTLICDPEKDGREQLYACLMENPMVEKSILRASTVDLMDSLQTNQINLLFIDPLALELGATSKLIFQIREQLPHVIICLFVRSSEVRRRTEKFYAGEQERFGHYFRLNKELTGPSFDEETTLMVSHCFEAARRLSRNPRRIRLFDGPKSLVTKPTAALSFTVEPQPARAGLSPVGMTGALPATGFLSFLPGLKYFARHFSPPQ